MKKIILIIAIFLTSYSATNANNDWKPYKIIPDIEVDLPCVPKGIINKIDNYSNYECNFEGDVYRIESIRLKFIIKESVSKKHIRKLLMIY